MKPRVASLRTVSVVLQSPLWKASHPSLAQPNEQELLLLLLQESGKPHLLVLLPSHVHNLCFLFTGRLCTARQVLTAKISLVESVYMVRKPFKGCRQGEDVYFTTMQTTV